MNTRGLYYGPVSPFARAVRIVLAEKNLTYEQAGILPEADVAPTLQIPTLVENGLVIWDSGVIIEHLMETYPNAPEKPERLPFADVLVRPGRELPDKLALATLHTLGNESRDPVPVS